MFFFSNNKPKIKCHPLPPLDAHSMQTKGGQKLTYRVQLFFEVLGGYRGQQHSLTLWKTVRAMEKKINIKNRDLISRKNQINVNNTEVFIFNIK